MALERIRCGHEEVIGSAVSENNCTLDSKGGTKYWVEISTAQVRE